jgi:hypothetical protein
MSKQDIIDFYKGYHAGLTVRYYADPDHFPGGKEAFDLEHANNWQAMEDALVAEGYSELPSPTVEERLTALEDKVL